jgi:hypothetical protein
MYAEETTRPNSLSIFPCAGEAQALQENINNNAQMLLREK